MKKLSRIRQIFCMILFGATTAVSAWFLARDIKLAVCHQNFEATITRIEFQKRYKSSGTYKIYVEYFDGANQAKNCIFLSNSIVQRIKKLKGTHYRVKQKIAILADSNGYVFIKEELAEEIVLDSLCFAFFCIMLFCLHRF